MSKQARLHRGVTLVALLLYPLFAGVFSATAGVPDEPTSALVSALAFLCAQAALGVWTVGVAQLLRGFAPVLGPVAAALLFISAFGHAAAAGFMVGQVSRTDAGEIPLAVNVIAVPTMLGLVGGTIVLAIALIRARRRAAWLGPVWIGWVVVEFGLSSLGIWAWLASAALLLLACVGMAGVVARSDLREWTTVPEWMAADPSEPARATA